jgi:hypothetical protein
MLRQFDLAHRAFHRFLLKLKPHALNFLRVLPTRWHTNISPILPIGPAASVND